jgi:hypothetical protein
LLASRFPTTRAAVVHDAACYRHIVGLLLPENEKLGPGRNLQSLALRAQEVATDIPQPAIEAVRVCTDKLGRGGDPERTQVIAEESAIGGTCHLCLLVVSRAERIRLLLRQES